RQGFEVGGRQRAGGMEGTQRGERVRDASRRVAGAVQALEVLGKKLDVGEAAGTELHVPVAVSGGDAFALDPALHRSELVPPGQPRVLRADLGREALQEAD